MGNYRFWGILLAGIISGSLLSSFVVGIENAIYSFSLLSLVVCIGILYEVYQDKLKEQGK